MIVPGAGHCILARTGRGTVWLLVAMVTIGPFLPHGMAILYVVGGQIALRLLALVDVLLIHAAGPAARWGKTFPALTLGMSLLFVAGIVLTFERYASFSAPSGSMLPTLKPGDHFHVDRSRRTPVWGDVIVFRLPSDPKIKYVKRVIGLPGDVVDVTEDGVILNSTLLKRSFVRKENAVDNQCHSVPARRFKETIDGRIYSILQTGREVTFHGPWTVPDGHLFVLGDNRDESQDSRTGFTVPYENVEGTVLTVFFSWDRCRFRIREVNPFERVR